MIETTTRTGTGITYLKCSVLVNEQTLRPARSAEKIHKIPHYPDSDECGKEGGTVRMHCGNHGSESLLSI